MRNRAFTLLELLIAIGIIALLLAIAFPIIIRAQHGAEVARLQMDLQAIQMGLAAYKADHKDYPRPGGVEKSRGARALALGMLGHLDRFGDNADGLGFRLPQARKPGPDGVLGNDDDEWQGRVFGPYVNADKFHTSADDDTAVLLDNNEKPILYYPVKQTPLDRMKTANGAYVASKNPTSGGTFPAVNAWDNEDYYPTATLAAWMGADGNGRLTLDQPKMGRGYLLVMAGPDGEYGTADDLTLSE